MVWKIVRENQKGNRGKLAIVVTQYNTGRRQTTQENTTQKTKTMNFTVRLKNNVGKQRLH